MTEQENQIVEWTGDIYDPPGTEDVVRFTAWMQARWTRHLEDEAASDSSGAQSVANNWLSECGHPCARHTVYLRTGAAKSPRDPTFMAVLIHGDIVERATVTDVREVLGLDWLKSQASVFDEATKLSGRIDGGVRRRRVRESVIIAEVKGMQGQAFNRVQPGLAGLYSIYDHPNWWIRKFLGQVCGYMYLGNEVGAVLILRNKATWDLKFVPVPRDHEVCAFVWSAIQERARLVNEHVDEGTIPDRIKWDKSICERCEYASTVCHPDRPAKGVEILTHPSLIQTMEECDASRETARTYDERWEWVKANLRAAAEASGRDRIIVAGRWEAKVASNGAVRVKPLPQGGLTFEEDDDDQ